MAGERDTAAEAPEANPTSDGDRSAAEGVGSHAHTGNIGEGRSRPWRVHVTMRSGPHPGGRKGRPGRVRALCAVPHRSGRVLLASAGGDGSVRLWDPGRGLAVGTPISGHAGLRERNIVTTSRSGNTIYYSLNSRKVIDAVDLLREFMAEFMTEETVEPPDVRFPSAG